MEMHHPSRRDNKYCFRLTKFSNLAVKTRAELEDEEDYLDAEGLNLMVRYVPQGSLPGPQRRQIRRIWGCADMEEIAELMKKAPEGIPLSKAEGNRGSVGFRRFQPEGKTGGNIQTFEWRHMAGSLNEYHVNQWIKACVGFTDFCRVSEPAPFRGLVDHIVNIGEYYSGIELLQMLRVDTRIFTDMLKAWAQDPNFCDDESGRELFVPK